MEKYMEKKNLRRRKEKEQSVFIPYWSISFSFYKVIGSKI